MEKDKVPSIIGAVLLVVGILVIFFVFFQAMMMVTNVGDYFRDQFPVEEGQEEAAGPTAAFSWNVNSLDVNFMDESEPGDSDIRHWDWQFGDGDSSNQQNPSHTYNSDGDYRIRLTVEDQNGKTDSINSNVYVEMGMNDGGKTEGDFGDMSFDFSMGNILLPIAAAILVSILFIVMFCVGAAMIKAGWNLIKPGPSTIKMKIKPKKLELEQGQPDPAYSQRSARAPHPVSAHNEPAYQPRPTPDAVIASMKSLPANQPPQQSSYDQGNSGYYAQQQYASSGPPHPMPQNPTPPSPSPSFESQPSQPIEDNTPHPDQTGLGEYQSDPADAPKSEPVQSTTPTSPDVPKTQTPTSQTPTQENKKQASVQSQQVTQKAPSQSSQSNSSRRQNNNSRPRQQQKRQPQNGKRSQQNKSRSKKGKGKGRGRKKKR
jgi:PKD repeat protein